MDLEGINQHFFENPISNKPMLPAFYDLEKSEITLLIYYFRFIFVNSFNNSDNFLQTFPYPGAWLFGTVIDGSIPVIISTAYNVGE